MTTTDRTEAQEAALTRARTSASMMNYSAILHGFSERGTPLEDIRRRETVLTFQAWRALGRHVKRGEHGVRVLTWIPCEKKDDTGRTVETFKRPKAATVFHISQTEPDQE